MKLSTKTKGFKALEKNYKQVIINTKKDKLLSGSIKKEFFDYLGNYDDSFTIENFCEKFYRMKKDKTNPSFDLNNLKYKFLGKTDLHDETIFYGHVELYKSFTTNLFQVLNIDISEIDDLVNKIIKGDEKAFASFIRATHIYDNKIRQVPLWSFKSLSFNDSAFILLRDSIVHLPGILGLDEKYNSKEWVAFGYNIPDIIDTKKPTAYDAELHIYWRPGGFTLNISKSRSKVYSNGLEEIVSFPIYYNDINSKLYKF
jgi:hypothetical protein